jgi:two-component system chemotaxis response regulator CheV
MDFTWGLSWTGRSMAYRSLVMAGVLDSVNQRTQLVGQNRLELLLFRLDGTQLYGINVFKVKEVLQCPRLTLMPKSSPVVRGVANIRGGTIPILDLSMATGRRGLDDLKNSFVIITEYNTKVQGFLVRSVERIVNMNWEEIHPPPKGTGRDHYLTAVTRVDKQLVEIIDVEKILAEVAPTSEVVSEGVVDIETQSKAVSKRVLIVDDSSVARKQVMRCLETVGVEVVALNDGRQAYNYLRQMAEDGKAPEQELLMIVSDIEMPEMDGYTLTAEIRNDPRMQKVHILLHTSLSGVFNQAMVKKVGADDFLAKFKPDDLAARVVERIRATDGG